VNNGDKGNTWIVSKETGEVTGEIIPAGTFSEGIDRDAGGRYWITDWDKKKLYMVEIEDMVMVPRLEVSLKPSRPTGVVWNGEHLYVITWTRGMGTAYHLLTVDTEGNILAKVKINGVHEPSQLAWDGEHLWISSWYTKRVYKVDTGTMRIMGHFKSPVSDTTGIVWDGPYMWLTGTKSDLYQLEIGTSTE